MGYDGIKEIFLPLAQTGIFFLIFTQIGQMSQIIGPKLYFTLLKIIDYFRNIYCNFVKSYV